MPYLQGPHLLFSTLYYSNFIVVLLVHYFYSPHYDSVSSLPNRSLHILVPSFRILVLVVFASCNNVFDRVFQNFVLPNAFFMVILANFAFTIDFVQRNADYTLYSRCAQLPFWPFLMAVMGGPTSAKRNRFGRCSVVVLGPGELIWRGNFYGTTDHDSLSPITVYTVMGVLQYCDHLGPAPEESFVRWCTQRAASMCMCVGPRARDG